MDALRFLAGFLLFLVFVPSLFAALHVGRLWLMDRADAAREQARRRRNPNIRPLAEDALSHPVRWYR